MVTDTSEILQAKTYSKTSCVSPQHLYNRKYRRHVSPVVSTKLMVLLQGAWNRTLKLYVSVSFSMILQSFVL